MLLKNISGSLPSALAGMKERHYNKKALPVRMGKPHGKENGFFISAELYRRDRL